MEKATLTISLPRPMKAYIESRIAEGRFSTPSEYIRALIRDDQDVNGQVGQQKAAKAAKTQPKNIHPPRRTAHKTDDR